MLCSGGNFGWHFIISSLSYNAEFWVGNADAILRILTHNTILHFPSDLCLFVAASHQTRLDTWSKARGPIKVGIKGRGRSGTSRDSNPAGLCCSSAHLVQCEPDEASSFTNPNLGPGTYAGLWLELDTKV